MNRRRFLSMLGMLPAALALPSVVGQSSKVRITVDAVMRFHDAFQNFHQIGGDNNKEV